MKALLSTEAGCYIYHVVSIIHYVDRGHTYALSKKVPKLSKNTRKPSKLMTAVKANANANWSPFGTAKQKYQRYTKKS